MLVRLKLFKFIICIVFLLSLQACSEENMILSQNDLLKPEKLQIALKGGYSSKQQELSERFYTDAVKMLDQKRWGVAAKGFKESAIHYPTARALIDLSQAVSKSHYSNEPDKGLTRLKNIKNYLTSALVIDGIQKKLTQNESEKAKDSINCIENYLEDQNKTTNCEHVENILGSK